MARRPVGVTTPSLYPPSSRPPRPGLRRRARVDRRHLDPRAPHLPARLRHRGSNTDASSPAATYAPAVYDGSRISSEKLGYAMDANLANVGGAKAGIVYDFYNARGDVNLYATDRRLRRQEGHPQRRLRLLRAVVRRRQHLELLRRRADERRRPARERRRRPTASRSRAGAHVRVFDVQTGGVQSRQRRRVLAVRRTTPPGRRIYPTNGHPFDEGGATSRRAGGRARPALALRGSGTWGDEGDRVGSRPQRRARLRVAVRRRRRTGRLGSGTTSSEPDRSTTTFNYVARRRATASRRARRAIVEWEHDINGLVGQRFRLMFLLTLAVANERKPAASLVALLRVFAPLLAIFVVVPLALAENPRRRTALHGLAPLPDDQPGPPQPAAPGLAPTRTTGPSDVIFPPQQHHAPLQPRQAPRPRTSARRARRATPAPTEQLGAATPSSRSGELCDACHSTDHSTSTHVKPGDDAMGQCAFCHVGYKSGRRQRRRRAGAAAGEPASSTTRSTPTGTSAARSATARSTSSSSRRATSCRGCEAASTATRSAGLGVARRRPRAPATRATSAATDERHAASRRCSRPAR